MRSHCEAILIPNLQDGVIFTGFLNGLLPRRFQFFLAESDKHSVDVEVLRRAQEFIQATEICAADDFVRQDT